MVKVVLDGQSLLATLCDVGVARNLYKGRFYTFFFSLRGKRLSFLFWFDIFVSSLSRAGKFSCFSVVRMVFLVFSRVS